MYIKIDTNQPPIYFLLRIHYYTNLITFSKMCFISWFYLYKLKTNGWTSSIVFRRHHHSHHAKFRKYSLPDDPKARKRHHQERRVSTQPEDQFLRGADQDQLDSHRSDDPRAFRRHRTSRPSNASLMHIGKGAELHPSLKKLYDHSPHAVSSRPIFISTRIISKNGWQKRNPSQNYLILFTRTLSLLPQI